MVDQLIESLISSDELILKTIEESLQSEKFNSLVDQFSSIMSMTTVQGEQLEKQMEAQGEKEAELIKGVLTPNLTQATNISLEKIAEIEATKEGSILSDQTVNDLINVISNIQGIIENIKPEEIATVTAATPITPTTIMETPVIGEEKMVAGISNLSIGNLGQVIDDFKTLSNLNWCTDWLKCLEKIIEQADVVKEALNSIPGEKKLSLGINQEELEKVDQSIQKVKDNISSDINLSIAKKEIIEQAAEAITPQQELSTPFINSFSELSEKLSSFTEKVENKTISQDSFINKVSQFSETTSKTIENTFTTFSDTTKTILEKPSTLETTLQTLESVVKTEIKPQLPKEFNLEELIFPPQIQTLLSPQTITPPTLIGETAAMPPEVKVPLSEININKTILAPEATPLSEVMAKVESATPEIGEVQPQLVKSTPMPLMPPEMGFGSLLRGEGVMSLPMTPITENVGTASAISGIMPNIPFPTPLNFEDILKPKAPTAETTIAAEVNKPEINSLNLESLINFGTNLPTIPTIGEATSVLGDIQMPLGLGQLGAVPSINPPKGLETTGVQVAANALPFGMDLSPLESLIGTEGEANKTIVESIQNFAMPNLNAFENLFQTNANQPMLNNMGLESAIATPPRLSANIEEMLIRNQEEPQVNLNTAFSKIQTEGTQLTTEKAATAEVMMSEVNLEPLGQQLNSSISTLGESLKTIPSTTQTAEINTTEANTNVMNQILAMLTKLDTTLKEMSVPSVGGTTVIPQGGTSLSDAQARTIGRQIANELKDSFSRLYN